MLRILASLHHERPPRKDGRTRTILVTDSSACLPQLEADATLLPLRIRFPGEEVTDGHVARERIVAALRRGDAVKTCPPSPADYLLAIERAGADEAIVLTPAAEFTVMYRNAQVAARHASIPVRVVDVRTAAAGHGLVAQATAVRLATGIDAATAAGIAADAASRVELVATIDSVEHLSRGGRVPSNTFSVAARRGVQPVFRLTRGEVQPVAIPREADGAVDQLVALWRAGQGADAAETVVMHAGREEEAAALAATLDGPAMVVPFSPAMTVHTGPGVLGVAWLRP